MAELTITTGWDAHVREGAPGQNNETVKLPQIKGGTDKRYVFLSMPLAGSSIAGRTILSASLSCAVQTNWVDQTVTVQAADATWNAATITWTDQPGVTGATASSGATGALSAGGRFAIDVTALVQAIADGQPNYGWRLSTSQTTDISTFRGFESGLSAWTLTVSVADIVEAPTHLAPTGVIGTDKPTLMVDNIDSLSAIQVQIDAASDAVSPDFDSGWVTVTAPQLDLTTTAYAGLGDGDTTYWRARLKTVNGSTSGWGPWVDITRADKPTIVDDTGTTIYDPTPLFEAHLSPAGDADTRWRLVIHAVDDPTDVRYDSGDAVAGAALAHEVPLSWDGTLVFPEDGDYQRVIYAWDRTDRVPSIGDTAYVLASDTITLTTSGDVTAPTDVAASVSGTDYPETTVTWTAGADPDKGFAVLLGDEVVAIAEPSDRSYVVTGAAPNAASVYSVRTLDDVGGVKKQSVSSATATADPTVTGIWLRTPTRDVKLQGTGITAQQVTKRQTFTLAYKASDVDIVTAVGGIEGEYVGYIDHRSSNLALDLAALESLRLNPARVARLVWGTHNIPVSVLGLSVTMMTQGDMRAILPDRPRYDVKFAFRQVPES